MLLSDEAGKTANELLDSVASIEKTVASIRQRPFTLTCKKATKTKPGKNAKKAKKARRP